MQPRQRWRWRLRQRQQPQQEQRSLRSKRRRKKIIMKIKHIVILASLWSKEMRNYFLHYCAAAVSAATSYARYELRLFVRNVYKYLAWYGFEWVWLHIGHSEWSIGALALYTQICTLTPVHTYNTWPLPIWMYPNEMVLNVIIYNDPHDIYLHQVYYNFLSRFFFFLSRVLYSLRVFSLIYFSDSRCVQMMRHMKWMNKKSVFFSAVNISVEVREDNGSWRVLFFSSLFRSVEGRINVIFVDLLIRSFVWFFFFFGSINVLLEYFFSLISFYCDVKISLSSGVCLCVWESVQKFQPSFSEIYFLSKQTLRTIHNAIENCTIVFCWMTNSLFPTHKKRKVKKERKRGKMAMELCKTHPSI